MSYWRDRVRREAIGLIDSLTHGEPREAEGVRFARRHNAPTLGELVRRMGLAPADFSDFDLSEEAIAERAELFVRTGKGIGRLRTWVRDLSTVCLMPTYLRSPCYRPQVERSVRLLRLVLDPNLVAERDTARRLTGLVVGYLLAGSGSPATEIVQSIARQPRELDLATCRVGMPDRNWADIALIAPGTGRRKPTWFVPLTVVARDCSWAPRPGALPVEAPGAEEGGGGSGARDFGCARLYNVAGGASAGRLLAHSVDADGLACVRCWSNSLDRADLRLAASLFCLAHSVAAARLDGEPLETSLD